MTAINHHQENIIMNNNYQNCTDNTTGAAKLAADKTSNLFSITSTRTTQKQAHAALIPDSSHMSWLHQQKESVLAYRRSLHDAFLLRCAKSAAVSEPHRQVAVKMLCAEAARYHSAHAAAGTTCTTTTAFSEGTQQEQTVAPVLTTPKSLEIRWWGSFAGQMDAFFNEACSDEDAVTCGNGITPSQRALENISSLGLWFVGEGISMSTRRYSMLVFSHHVPVTTTTTTDPITEGTNLNNNSVSLVDAECNVAVVGCDTAATTESYFSQVCYTPVYVPVVLVGLCQFVYSNFIQDVRAQTQAAVLSSFGRQCL
jgi:hypothetical protein